MFEFLKKVELFAGLPKEDLLQICREAEERRLVAGEVLCKEGEPGDEAYVIQEGRLEVVKESDGREVLLAVRESGEVIGEMALLEEAPRVATIRAATECLLVVVDKETLDHLLATSISAANAMFRTILARWRGMEGMLRQSEKMAQLGTMSAGIAHELNNPAAAVTRSAGQLQAAIGVLGEADARLRKVSFAEEQDRAIADLAATLVDRKRPAELDALARSDREFELEDWLDDRGGGGRLGAGANTCQPRLRDHRSRCIGRRFHCGAASCSHRLAQRHGFRGQSGVRDRLGRQADL